MPEQIFIEFDSDHLSRAIIVISKTTPPKDVVEVMNLEALPQGILSISGGAGKFPPEIEPQTRLLIESVIVPLAYEHNLMVIDGGTDAGVMQIIGDAFEKINYHYPQIIGRQTLQEPLSRPLLIGFAPRPKVYAPGIGQLRDGCVLLNQNHTYFILIADVDEWGEEIDYMSSFIDYFAVERRIPVLHVIFNGGRFTIKEMYYAVNQRRPVLLLEGSTRAVEVIVTLLNGGSHAEITQMLLDKARSIAEEDQLEEIFEWLSAIKEYSPHIDQFSVKTHTPDELNRLVLSHLHL